MYFLGKCQVGDGSLNTLGKIFSCFWLTEEELGGFPKFNWEKARKRA